VGRRGPRLPLPVDLADWPEWRELERRHGGHEMRALRDLYVQMLLHCYSKRSDGYVSAGEVCALVGSDSPRTAERDVNRLVDARLVNSAIGGFMVPDYVRRFGAREAIEGRLGKQSDGARRANHDRWHMKRGERVPECVFCQSADQYSDQCTDVFTDQLADEYTDQLSDQYTDQVTDPAEKAVLFKRVTPPIVPPKDQLGDELSSRFTDFWEIYPRRVGKPRALKAWRAAMKRRHDPELIIKAATAYRDDPQRKPQFTAHPSTWLNDERYNDDPSGTAGGDPGIPRRIAYPDSPYDRSN
jgi:hypothetical protein